MTKTQRAALFTAALTLTQAFFPVLAQAVSDNPAPSRANRAMQAVRLAADETLVLDGTLSHPAWKRAPVYEQFVEKDPNFGAAPPQITRVQVLFDEKALYVGVTALDSQPALIRDPIVRADQVNRTQDFVAVYIDAIGSKRSAQFFRVNAAGSMADGLHTANDDSEDFSPDFDWDAAASRSAQGYTALFRLPFASLRFTPGAHDWRILVVRRLPRENFHMLTSVAIPREAPSFIDTMQPLLGVQLPQDSRFLQQRLSITLRRDDAAFGAASKNKLSASLDAKWRPLPQAVLDATLNPDFSQVALDVPQLAGNARFALFFPEKRPFFFESTDLLRTPTEAFYTRSFTEPRWGLRGTWRSTDWAGTALALDDRGKGLVLLPRAYGTGAAAQPASRALALRARSDGGAELLPPGLQLGAVMASSQYAENRGSNTVLGPDMGWQLNDNWRLRAQWLHSETSALPAADGLRAGPARGGDLLHLRVFHQTDDSEANFGVDDLGENFRHDSGFVNQVGVRKVHTWLSRNLGRMGLFNQFWLNAEWDRVVDRSTGQLVSEYLRPGIWTTGAHNLEWWVEFYGHSVLRTGPLAPLLRERFVATGLLITPARWFPMLDTKLIWGQRADTVANDVRPGGSFKLVAKLRPLPRLEFETTANTAWLRKDGQRSYAETAVQGLAVWHFGARHNLRAIVENTSLTRHAEGPQVQAQRSKDQTVSLTYGWRESSGTVLYVGYSRGRNALLAGDRSQELFVKLQLDVDEARTMLRRR